MEATLQRKESKKHKRKDDTEEQMATEEGSKERRHRKKSHGKRKKKRSSIPNTDEVLNSSTSTSGRDNIALQLDENLGTSEGDRINAVEPQERAGEYTNISVSQTEENVSLPVRDDKELRPADDVRGQQISRDGSGSEIGLRRRATLTEIGKSFDEDEAHRSSEVSIKGEGPVSIAFASSRLQVGVCMYLKIQELLDVLS